MGSEYSTITGHNRAERRIRAEVAEAVGAEIAARRNADPLRRRFLDETLASASRLAIAAAVK